MGGAGGRLVRAGRPGGTAASATVASPEATLASGARNLGRQAGR